MILIVSAVMFTTAWRTRDRKELIAQEKQAAAVQTDAVGAIRPPTIVSVESKTLTARPDPQLLVIKGRDFAPGLTATVTSPREVMTTFGPELVGRLTPTSCALPARLDERGTYQIVVRNRGEQRSNVMTFVVR